MWLPGKIFVMSSESSWFILLIVLKADYSLHTLIHHDFRFNSLRCHNPQGRMSRPCKNIAPTPPKCGYPRRSLCAQSELSESWTSVSEETCWLFPWRLSPFQFYERVAQSSSKHSLKIGSPFSTDLAFHWGWLPNLPPSCSVYCRRLEDSLLHQLSPFIL